MTGLHAQHERNLLRFNAETLNMNTCKNVVIRWLNYVQNEEGEITPPSRQVNWLKALLTLNSFNFIHSLTLVIGADECIRMVYSVYLHYVMREEKSRECM